MPKQSPDQSMLDLLSRRCIASLATENDDGSIHLTAVWFVYDSNGIYIATSSRSRKSRNLTARRNATLMVDIRRPNQERGVTVTGTAELLSDEQSRAINQTIYKKYLSEKALEDPDIVPVFAAMDDTTIRLTPASWFSWNLAEVDAQFFAGQLAANPGYLLPLD